MKADVKPEVAMVKVKASRTDGCWGSIMTWDAMACPSKGDVASISHLVTVDFGTVGTSGSGSAVDAGRPSTNCDPQLLSELVGLSPPLVNVEFLAVNLHKPAGRADFPRIYGGCDDRHNESGNYVLRNFEDSSLARTNSVICELNTAGQAGTVINSAAKYMVGDLFEAASAIGRGFYFGVGVRDLETSKHAAESESTDNANVIRQECFVAFFPTRTAFELGRFFDGGAYLNKSLFRVVLNHLGERFRDTLSDAHDSNSGWLTMDQFINKSVKRFGELPEKSICVRCHCGLDVCMGWREYTSFDIADLLSENLMIVIPSL
ncbi:MAG TPA: hypothetical protein VN699_15590 [Pirellulales bacterium]|nr:hypothetical protein [Pirellulales bacterium]